MMAKRANEYDEEGELREAFRVFDKNGNGFIRVSELRSVLWQIDRQMQSLVRSSLDM